jgi:hypothetical protein
VSARSGLSAARCFTPEPTSFNFLEVRVYHIFLLFATRVTAATIRSGTIAAGSRLSALSLAGLTVHGFGQLVRGVRQGFGGPIQLVDIFGFELAAGVIQRVFDRLP